MTGLQKICKALCDEYASGKFDDDKDKSSKMYRLGFKFGERLYAESLNNDNIDMVVQTAIKVAKKEKKTSQVLEERILEAISFHLNIILSKEEVQGFPKLTSELVETETNKKYKNYHKIALRIRQLAEDLLAVKKSRDAFSGKRKKYALELLMSLSDVYEIDGIEEIFVMGLKAKGRDLLQEVLDAIPIYYKEKEISENMIELIKKRASKAKRRSELVGCLQALIELNIIGEFEALDQVDEWKEQNYY